MFSHAHAHNADRLPARTRSHAHTVPRLTSSSGFAEVLDGVVSVRAFSDEARFVAQLCEAVDKTNSAFYYYWVSRPFS